MISLGFDNFAFDHGSNTLTQAGENVPIEPQVAKVLDLLLTNRGKIVSRDELLSNVWEGRAVSPAVVDNRIRAARLALNDDGRHQRFIKTVVSQGFMFVDRSSDQDELDHPPRIGAAYRATVSAGQRFFGRLQSRLATAILTVAAVVAASVSLANGQPTSLLHQAHSDHHQVAAERSTITKAARTGVFSRVIAGK